MPNALPRERADLAVWPMIAGEPRVGITETLYFYEGEITTTEGYVEVPKEFAHWLPTYLQYGYRFEDPTDEAEYMRNL